MTTVSPKCAEPPLVLTIDIGSSSVRALLYDGLGRSVQHISAHETYRLHTTREGAVQDNPEAALQRVARCIDRALQQAGPLAGRISAVGLATLAATLIALDRAGRPLSPVLMYADTRSDADALRLRRRLAEREIHQRTGCLLRPGYWPAQLAWLRRAHPELRRKAARWVSLGEYIELALFGRSRVSYSIASWSGLLDRHRLSWDQPLLSALGISADQLSPLVETSQPIRGLIEGFRQRWPALSETPWFAAVGDGAAANLGSGCVDQTCVALSIGTTGALRLVTPAVASIPDGLWLYRVDQQQALLGGATSEGGNLYAWLRETVGLEQIADLERALAAMPPAGHGLTVLPFIAGERSPGWGGNIRATIHGLSLDTTPLDILQAGLESIAYRFALIAQRFDPHTSNTRRFLASGGALRSSPAWAQIMADVLGQPVALSAEAEATSRGVALLALRALGAIPTVGALPAAEGAVYQPHAERQATHQEALARQQQLYAALHLRARDSQ